MTAQPLPRERVLTFRVLGRPAPQGSKHAIVNRYTGKPALVESSKQHLVPWRQAVTAAALEATIRWETDNREVWLPMLGPCSLVVMLRFARPAGHYGTGKNRHTLKDSAPYAPDTKNYGDADHHARAVKDALTAAGVWRDDAQVCDLDVKKRWAMPPDYPMGARVTVRCWGLP